MDPTNLTDDQLDALAQQLAGRLPTGTHGDRVVLSRRQFAAAATGTLGAGALMALGVDEASAQAAGGSVGTASSPVDAYAYDLNVANGVTSSLPMNGNAIENAGSVSTADLSLGGVQNITYDGQINSSGSQSHTYSLSNTYDQVIVWVQEWINTSGGIQALQLRTNGISTTDYNNTTIQGNTTTGDPGAIIDNFQNNVAIRGTIKIDGRWYRDQYIWPEMSGQSADLLQVSENTAATAPMNQITFRGDGGTVSIKAHILGWNGNL